MKCKYKEKILLNGKGSILLAALGYLFWFFYRVGTKPTRIAYPCQQAGVSHILFSFSAIILPAAIVYIRSITGWMKKNYIRVIIVSVLIAGTFAGVEVQKTYKKKRLIKAGSRTIPQKEKSIFSNALIEKENKTLGYAKSVHVPAADSENLSIVSFSHDKAMSYGTSSPPYDKDTNPVYDFVWKTVERLNFGDPGNPLKNLISPGDKVLIKPNLVLHMDPYYTHPEVVRPLIDMAIAAGASEIQVGDGNTTYSYTEKTLADTGYKKMIRVLKKRNRNIRISTVNLNNRKYWRWIYLGDKSSFAGSPYTDSDLMSQNHMLYNTQYYSTSDYRGKNPGGECLGWYAISRYILDADVIINVPKLKMHGKMIITGCIKAHVGSVIASTHDDKWYAERIAHYKTDAVGNEFFFNNDIFWRAILDINRIVLYSDRQGRLQHTRQRKYFNVIDGIVGAERDHGAYKQGIPYNSKIILAGTDPVATDAVACRLIGYDYRVVPSIINAINSSDYPIGTNNPENITVIGDEINDSINHIYMYSQLWGKYAKKAKLDITDFVSPSIIDISYKTIDKKKVISVETDSDTSTAYVLYEIDGDDYLKKMTKKGDNLFAAVIHKEKLKSYRILVQDNSFNTSQSRLLHI
ncbi:MAG: DUF362 domain-containing protein [Elusimicrobiota bacterium]